ncbi:hypothetical protein LOD99_15241 [Oopsacas minuta]|uniref:Uncharacterized protein n=1 Tax=Oopsacas minuta TaxID=111878 RepID=A0AAV7KBK0_9METZ|nr:hypothetical protein LOD99_15241 [Oopsacas minuta]
MTDNFDYSFNITIVGSEQVEKSSIRKHFASNIELNTLYDPTIRVDFSSHIIKLDEVRIKLRFWDTAGSEIYPQISPAYYIKAHGIIMVYDVTDLYSFGILESYLSKALKLAEEKTKIMLVANNCDLIGNRKISYETGKEFADAHNLLYFEVSCKSHEQVEYAIVSLASLIVENEKRNEYILKQKNNSNVGSTHSREAARDSSKCNLL